MHAMRAYVLSHDIQCNNIVVALILRLFLFQYLYNLDPNSAYYDPKTRSMRENPFKEREGSGNE